MSLHQKSSIKKPLIAGLSSPFGPPMWFLMIHSVSCDPLRQSQSCAREAAMEEVLRVDVGQRLRVKGRENKRIGAALGQRKRA